MYLKYIFYTQNTTQEDETQCTHKTVNEQLSKNVAGITVITGQLDWYKELIHSEHQTEIFSTVLCAKISLWCLMTNFCDFAWTVS